MSWRVVVRPEVWDDVDEATRWYDARADGLGNEFVEEVIRVLDALADNPLLKLIPAATRVRISVGVILNDFLTA